MCIDHKLEKKKNQTASNFMEAITVYQYNTKSTSFHTQDLTSIVWLFLIENVHPTSRYILLIMPYSSTGISVDPHRAVPIMAMSMLYVESFWSVSFWPLCLPFFNTCDKRN